jgi:hypothetical protein
MRLPHSDDMHQRRVAGFDRSKKTRLHSSAAHILSRSSEPLCFHLGAVAMLQALFGAAKSADQIADLFTTYFGGGALQQQ